jgi:hypothetical protein
VAAGRSANGRASHPHVAVARADDRRLERATEPLHFERHRSSEPERSPAGPASLSKMIIMRRYLIQGTGTSSVGGARWLESFVWSRSTGVPARRLPTRQPRVH